MMKNISVLKSIGNSPDKTRRTNHNMKFISRRWYGINLSILSLIAEVGVNFFRYLKGLGISGETNLIVLSSKHQYNCDEKDLKNVRILINLKKLNLIKHLDFFLNTLVRILPPNATFIGYFSDNKISKGEDMNFKNRFMLFARLKNFIRSGKVHSMNKYEVTELLERNGFKTIDMKEINGLTYFNSQIIAQPA